MEKEKNTEKDEMRAEYDFTNGVRGKHAGKFKDGYVTIVHKADGTTEITFMPPPQKDK
jgi:hypothetical protein